jgi:hypothetical protein
MPEHLVWIFSGAVSGCGLLTVAAYVWTVKRTPSTQNAWWDRLDTLDGVLRRKRRRHLGMAIVTLLSLAFCPGTLWLDPRTAPISALTYWTLMLLLVMWLCGLAFSDVLHTRRLRIHLLQQARNRIATRVLPKNRAARP